MYPGIADIEDLHVAREHGVSFVRVGVNADQPEATKEYIVEGKKLGMTVMANFMKSYIVTPERFSENARIVESYGADCVYIVDQQDVCFQKNLVDTMMR